MQITLKPSQERVLQEAIRTGLVRSVDDFVESAIQALPHRQTGFDKERARIAAGRIREIRKGVRLNRQGETIRELAHAGHKY